jgi:3-oxoacyl-[acyl-carrier protein] reductase
MTHRALITGASRGIGAAVAEALAAAGHPVILNYRSQDEAAKEVKKRIEARGGSVVLSRFDVAHREATAEAIARLLEDESPIGIVVNNAGITRDALLPVLKPEDWDLVLRTSLDGWYNVTKPLVMPMVRRRFGRIITVTSVSGLTGQPGQTNYSAAKAGLMGATKALAKEVARKGVTVNAVAPGLIETDMIEGAPVDELLRAIPVRRLGRPEEVASLVAFLASADAGYITGQVIGINGGLL